MTSKVFKLNANASLPSFEGMESRGTQRSNHLWNVLGKKLPESEVVFFSQVVLVYIVILTCMINLSRGAGDSNLWTCLMSSCLGYLLPNPKIDRNRDGPNVHNSPQQ